MRPFVLHALTALALGTLAVAPAAAQTPKFISTQRDWTLYDVQAANGHTCYIASEPKKQEGTYKQRGNPAVLVARLPGDPPSEQVSVQPGYTFKKGSGVQLTVDGRRFDLFTQGEHAWTRTDGDDKALIEAMKNGSSLVIKGTSSRETTSSDTYSLNGFTAAWQAMRDACAK